MELRAACAKSCLPDAACQLVRGDMVADDRGMVLPACAAGRISGVPRAIGVEGAYALHRCCVRDAAMRASIKLGCGVTQDRLHEARCDCLRRRGRCLLPQVRFGLGEIYGLCWGSFAGPVPLV